MLKALQLGSYEPQLLLLVLPFVVKDLLQHLEPVNCRIYVLQVIVQQWLRFVDVERAGLQQLSFQTPHVSKCRVLEYMHPKVVLHEIQPTRLVQIDPVSPS